MISTLCCAFGASRVFEISLLVNSFGVISLYVNVDVEYLVDF